MFRPANLLLLCCLTAVVLVPGVAKTPGQGIAAEKKGKSRDLPALPEVPLAGLLDHGSVFNGDDRGLIESAIKAFGERVGMPVFIVTENYLLGETVDEYGDRLATGWLNGKPGVVLIYERASGRLNYSATPGSLGKNDDPRSLFVTGSKAAAALPEDSSAAQRMTAAVEAMTEAGGVWKETGKMPSPASPPSPAPAAPPKSDKSTAPPVDFVIDDAEVFHLEEAVSLKTTLVKFNGKHDMDLYVLTWASLPQGSAQERAENLAGTWLKDRFGAVLVFNAAAGPEDSLGIAGAERNESLIPPPVFMKSVEAARSKVRSAPRGSEAVALRAAADVLMEVFVTRGVPARAENAQPTTPDQWRVLTAVAAALVVGTALLFLFHRLQERLESRSREQYFFPEVTVDRRLGSPQGGGQVAGISFAEKPDAS